MMLTMLRHQPTKACQHVHCHSCHVDEPGVGYIVCGECGHLYRTAGELRRAYRRTVLATPRDDVSRWRVVLSALTIRARDIRFCQECTHDF